MDVIGGGKFGKKSDTGLQTSPADMEVQYMLGAEKGA